jgi:hypothetical protein
MGQRVRSWALVAAATLCVAAGASARAIGGHRSNRSNRNRKPSRYYVLLLKDAAGLPLVEVVGNTKYSDRRHEIEEEYKEALKFWAQARAEAKRAGEPFEEKPPQGPKLYKRLKSFKEEEEAEEFAEKLQEMFDRKIEKMRAERGEKDDGFLDDPPDDDKKKDDPKGKDEKKDEVKGKED